ncbi:MAG TPA: hypothetical protein VH482_09050 [Thermomicrobiales bacterium]|jgi:hypothetical protein
MTDEEFLRFFDGVGQWAGPVRFGHREHLRLAWLCLSRDGEARGGARTIAAIRRVAAAHGASEKYHETITRFWLRLVAHHLASDPAAVSFDDFLSHSPRLLDVGLMRRHYRPETLAGERARREWVEPDLAPLPA